MNRPSYYILQGKTPIPVDMITWATWIELPDNKILKHTTYNDIMISTVFLGLDHQYGDGPPILFETMIFGGEHDQYQERYTTYDKALEGHKEACALVMIPEYQNN